MQWNDGKGGEDLESQPSENILCLPEEQCVLGASHFVR